MKALIVAAFVAFFAVPASAAVVYTESTRSLEISGATNVLQLMMAKKVFAESEVRTIYMSGPGGSFYIGLDLGRAIEASGARVIITGRCVSACAFAAMGSADILIDEGGELMFHRPYLTSVPAIGYSIDDMAGEYGGFYLAAARYVLERGFTMQFAQLIVAKTKPCVLYVFTDSAMLNKFRGAALDRLVVVPVIRTIDTCNQESQG